MDPHRTPAPPAWADLTSPELAEWARRDGVAVLPVAAIEQHGPHLPLSTDRDIGEGVLRVACAESTVRECIRVLPTLTIGASPEHADFPGTLTRPAPALADDIEGVGARVAHAGVRRLVLLNSHGGNRAAIDDAALRLRQRHGLLVVKAHTFRFPWPDDTPLSPAQRAADLHGGAVETALMRVIAPDKVRDDAVASATDPQRQTQWVDHCAGRTVMPEGVAATAWMAQDLDPSGVAGDPTLGTVEFGHALLAAYAHALQTLLIETLDRSLPELLPPGGA